MLATAGVMGLLAVGTGTAWFVATGGGSPTTGGGNGNGSGESTAVTEWAVPLTNADSTDFTSGLAFASWLTDKTIIRAQKDGILAYALNSGKRAWGTPAPGAQLCGATQHLAQGKGAIAYGSSTLCDHLAGVDTATGKLTWKIKISAEKARISNSLTVPRILDADGMAIVDLNDVLTGYRLSDGGKQWTATMPNGCHLKDANAAPGRVAMLLDCFTAGNRLLLLNPQTGKATKQTRIGELRLMSTLLSADPVIMRTEDSSQNVFTVYNDAGAKVTEFKTGKVDLLAMNTVAFVDGMFEVHRYAVHGDHLYLATFPENVPGKLRSRNQVLAYDLKTGRQVWTSSGTNDTMLTYIRADDRGLLALEAGDHRDLAPRLVRLDAATGKATAVASLPQKYGSNGQNAQVFERNGTVIIVPWTSVTAKYAITYVNTKGS
ncbi:PQQ-binding-like beta-propeller repeat protein [Nonomuraea sp. CA-141351]|uniref:outer membrane protein assembly factor BamB family protein n=1 Tax=Nonomuraea sp. CA-141351 TaxID=3239996 RepID=UPI003D90D2D2